VSRAKPHPSYSAKLVLKEAFDVPLDEIADLLATT